MYFALVSAKLIVFQYESKTDLPTLEGAVNDAKEFCKFLVDKFQVLESNILLLCNGQATRARILDAFKTHLLNNPRIPNGGDAATIFFFAGHGTRVSAPGNLMSEYEQVEGICAVDERTGSGKEYVHMIPDSVLVRLLLQLSEKKGQNIVHFMFLYNLLDADIYP